MIVEVCGSASAILSFTAVTVTVCAAFQFSEVKVSDVGLTVVWVSGEMVIVTSAVGCVSRTTVYVSVAPPSTTSVEPADSVIVTPGTATSSHRRSYVFPTLPQYTRM